MTHVEGPIVQSFYDMSLLSWGIAQNPVLPLVSQPMTAFATSSYNFGLDNAYIACKNIEGLDQVNPASAREQPAHPSGKLVPDSAQRLTAITEHLSEQSTPSCPNLSLPWLVTDAELQPDTKGTLPTDIEMEPFRPHIIHAAHRPFPVAMVNRAPHGRPGHSSTENPMDAAFLAGFRYAKSVSLTSYA